MKAYAFKYEGKMKHFQYNREKALVSYVTKATAAETKDNIEWMIKYNKPLWDIDSDGYIEITSAGLSNKNWDNKEARDEYLNEWCFEMAEEIAYIL